MRKKVFAIILSLLACIGLFCTVISAETSGECGSGVFWVFDEPTGKLTVSGSGKMTSAPWTTSYTSSIKEVVIEEGVTAISYAAFRYCENMQKIKFPSTLKEIGTYSFQGCINIERVDIASVESWCKISFYSTSPGYCYRNPLRESNKDVELYVNGELLKHVEIPEGITKVSGFSFLDCKHIESVSFPSTVTTIDSNAFENCTGITELILPNKLTTIGTNAFANCSSVNKIWIPATLKVAYSKAFIGCKIKEVHVENLSKWLAASNYSSPMTGSDLYENGQVVTEYVASSMNKYGLLQNCTSIKKVTIKTTSVSESYLSSCPNLEEVVFTDSLKTIGTGAFSNCGKLSRITIPQSVTSIGSYAFQNCKSITGIELPSGLTTIPTGLFYGCENLKSINIHSGIKTITKNPFEKCHSLASFDVAEDNVYFSTDENGALYDINQNRLISVASGKGDNTYTIKPLLTSFESGAFGNKVQQVFVDNENTTYKSDEYGAVHSYNMQTFMYFPSASALTTYKIPSTTKSINSYAFSDATGLKKVYIPQTVSTINNNNFDKIADTVTLYVVPGSYGETYAKNYKLNYEYNYSYNGTCGTNLSWLLEDGVLTISGSGNMNSYNSSSACPWYSYRSSINSIVLCDGVTSIGSNAFAFCENLENIKLPVSMKTVGASAFSNCTSLKNVELNDGLTTLGYCAFTKCTELESLYIPASVTEINEMFTDCTKLKRIDIPDIEAFERSTFNKGMEFFPNGDVMLYENDQLVTEVVITTSAGKFKNSGFLEKIVFAEGVEYVYVSGMKNLEIIYIPSTVKKSSANTAITLNCPKMKEFIVHEDNAAYVSLDGVLYTKDMRFLAEYPPQKKDLRYVIPDGVIYILGEAFRQNSYINEIKLPDTVKYIYNKAFYNCTNLKNVSLSEGVLQIGQHAFSDTSVDRLFVPFSVKLITAPLGVSVIEGYMDSYAQTFAQNNNLEFIPAGQSPLVLDYGKFGDGFEWKLSTKYVLNISGNGEMPDFNAPSDVPWYQYLGEIKQIAIGEGVTSVGKNSFCDLINKTEILLADTVVNADYDAFAVTEKLTVYGKGNTGVETVLKEKGISFVSVLDCGSAGESLQWIVTDEYVLKFLGEGEMYDWNGKDSVPWKNYKTLITNVDIADGVENLGAYSLSGCSAIKALYVPESVRKIRDAALNGCISLQEVTLPFIGSERGSEYTEQSVFGSIFGFIGVNGTASFSDGVIQRFEEVKGDKGLYGAFIPSSLKKVTITDEDFIAYGAFSNCVFDEIVIPKDIEYISPYAFYNTTTHADMKVTYPGTLKAWERIPKGDHNSIAVNITGEALITKEPEIEVYDVLGGKKVRLSSEENASIYYTLDGTKPSFSSLKYTSEIFIDKAGDYKITAIAAKKGCDESYIVTQSITVNKADKPGVSINSGLVAKGTPIELLSDTDDTRILYTTDNSDPDMNSDEYSSPVLVDGFMWLKAIAVKSGYENSDVAIYNYTDEYAIPDISTEDATFVSKNSAVLNGNIKNKQELGFFEAEFVVYEKNDPDNVKVVPLNDQTFISVDNLDESTEYCFFLRVTNGDKVSEGNVAEFRTKNHYIPLEIVLNNSGLRLQNGRSYTLKATLLPEEAPNKDVIWTSFNPAVASVDANGVVKAKSKGKTTIVATSAESGVYACCDIVVYNKYVTEEVDISELNMYTNIREFAEHGFHFDMNDEGSWNYNMLAYLTNWDGAVAESRDKYFGAGAGSAQGYVLEDYYNELDPDYHVQNVYILPVRENSYDNDEIKRAIKKYGAVSAVMYADYSDMSYGLNGVSYYYNQPWNWSTGNHLITLVGWDDNYPASNFNIRPEGDGAFIVKNSWGTTSSWGNEVGEDGFFYISYYDTVLARYTNSYVYPELETKSNYNNIWQYDYTGPSYKLGYKNSVYAANVFPQDGRALAEDEVLRAVSFHTSAQDMGYEIYVIDDFKDESSLVVNGSPVKSGTIHEMGYHTIELDEYIKIDSGKRFAVVVRLIRGGDAVANMYVEKLWTRNTKMEYFDNVGFYSADGSLWSEVPEDTNVCIKAFTDYADINKAVNSVYKSNKTIETASTSINLKNADSSYTLKPYHFGGLYPDLQDTTINDFVSDIDLPEKYDLRELNYVTKVKDQGGFGMCAAFGTAASIESCVLKRIEEGALNPEDNNGSNRESEVSVSYSDGLIYVNSVVDSSLYIATYNDLNEFAGLEIYPVKKGSEISVPYNMSDSKAFIWDKSLRPLSHISLR